MITINWRAHFLIGTIAVFVMCYLLGTDLLEAVPLSLFGGMSALLPDLDHESGKMRQILNRIIPLIAVFVLFVRVCGSSIACLFSFSKLKTIGILALALTGIYFILFTYLKPKHRGITHSLFFAIAYGVVLFIGLDEKIASAGFVGYLSHLLADNEVKLL